jgi:protocatechuate 3,4-dioxygenase beta subunit
MNTKRDMGVFAPEEPPVRRKGPSRGFIAAVICGVVILIIILILIFSDLSGDATRSVEMPGPRGSKADVVIGGVYGITPGGERIPLKDGAALEEYSSVQTGPRGVVSLILSDSVTLCLGVSSRIDFLNASSVSFPEGRFCARTAGGAIHVKLPTGRLVTGNGEFYVEAYPHSVVRVFVTSGSVAVFPRMLDGSVELKAGYYTSVVPGTPGAPRRIKLGVARRRLAWTHALGFSHSTSALPGRLVGTVQDASGRGVAGAALSLAGADNRRFKPFHSSGPDGRFKKDGIEPGTYGLSVSAIGFFNAAESEVHILPGQDTELELGLVPETEARIEPGAISGTVFDERYTPVKDAKVTAGGRSTLSGKDGAFTLADLSAGVSVLKVEKKGFNTFVQQVDVEPGKTEYVEVVLAPAKIPAAPACGDVLVYVRGKEGKALGGVSVSVMSRGIRIKPVVRTGPVGSAMFPDVKPGTYEVRCEKNGYHAAGENITVVAGRTAELIVTMKSTSAGETAQAVITGKVITEGGEPVRGAVVTLGSAPEGVAGIFTTTDSAGRFTFDGLPAGEYVIIVLEKGEGTASRSIGLTAGEKRKLTFTLVPVGRVRVVVTDDKAIPIAAAEVAIEKAPPGQALLKGKTDAQGALTFDKLKAGTYTISASHPRKGKARRENITVRNKRTQLVILSLLKND